MSADPRNPTVVVYVVSRFPEATQTWLLRELEVVSADPEIECELISLFRPVERTATVHPAAERWMPRVRRSGPGRAVRATGWWLLRSPLRLMGAIAAVIAAYARHPSLLVRALATVAIAADHARALSGMRASHLHAHTATYPALAAWTCWYLTGIPYAFTAHAHDIFVDQSFLGRRIRDARFVVAISDFNRGFLAAYGGDRPTPVHVVRCGLDPDAYTFRARVPPPEGPVRALCIGGFKEYKGHEMLLEALATTDDLERVSLDLVGDGPLRERLVQAVSELGLEDRVRFHGAIREPDVTALLDQAEIFVLPSVIASDGTTEGLPVALMEALAAGVPVVATRVSGVPELIRDGETGLLAEPGSPAELGRALRVLLDDPDGARSRAEAGRLRVERDYDAKRTAAELARLFKQGMAE